MSMDDKATCLWSYNNHVWTNNTSYSNTTKHSFNNKISEIIKELTNNKNHEAKLYQLSQTSSNAIQWSAMNTILLFQLIEKVGTHWPVIADRFVGCTHTIYNEMPINSILPQFQSINGDYDEVISIYFDNYINIELSVNLCSELKDRFYFILRQLYNDDMIYRFNGKADHAYKQGLLMNYTTKHIDDKNKIKEIIDLLGTIAVKNMPEKNDINNRLSNYLKTNLNLPLISLNNEDQSTFAFAFVPYVDVIEQIFKSRGVSLSSQICNSCIDIIYINIKQLQKNNWLIGPGKDYHEIIYDIFTKSKDNLKVDSKFLKDIIAIDEIGNTNYNSSNFMPVINSYETFNAYAVSVYEAYILASLTQQLKQLNQYINQWNSKINDIRRSIKITKQTKKFTK